MALNVVLGFLIPFQERITNVTQLLGESLLKFGRPFYSLAVSESASPGPLLQLTVKIYSEGIRVQFEITEGNEGQLFYLDPNSGLLSLARQLDFESQPEHVLIVRASLQEEFSEAKVLIEVLDDNDHPPQFQRDLHETQITEEDDRHLPKIIMSVSAYDSDAGKHGDLRYFLKEDYIYDQVLECFSVDEKTGDILLLKPLDRDPPYGQSKWLFDVVATDGQFESSTSVIVNVKDVNDNAPYFVETLIKAFVMENRPEGTLVTTVGAIDHDDPEEGTNAKIVYSLEKNVIDESTGRPIFSVNEDTGRVETALCCLDREKTDRYTIQVVATDGGGLKGTGTVLVNISDENDVPPKFSRAEWFIDVKEELRQDDVVASINVIDPDVINDFKFKIVSGSGNGWNLFYVTKHHGKQGVDVRTKYGLDFENPRHRVGFRFQILVSDMGDVGWEDKYHIDSTWVNLRLSDINDNTPKFLKEAYHKNILESASPGTPLVAVKAVDVDNAGASLIQYRIDPKTDPSNLFQVDQSGVVRLRKPLDRETSSNHRLIVWAVDQGEPVKTAMATIVVDVRDVNDNPPHLISPSKIRVRERTPPHIVANVSLGDADDWNKGHGPPFSLHLDSEASSYIKKAVDVQFDSGQNNGIGHGIVRTLIPLDREKMREILVPLVASDAGRPASSATLTLTISVDDVNDNKMKEASKTVSVHLLKPGLPPSRSSMEGTPSRIHLGRIYVDDPDDWDTEAKDYRWKKHNAFFSLGQSQGQIFMEPWTPPGRYVLHFLVSDVTHKQKGVPAHVIVKVLPVIPNDLKSALPVEFEAESKVFVQQIDKRPSLLDVLSEKIRGFISGNNNAGDFSKNQNSVRIVSVQQLKVEKESLSRFSVKHLKKKTPKTRIWMTHPPEVNLEHILLLNQKTIEGALGVKMLSVGGGECAERPDCQSGCWMQTEVDKDYSLIDANSTSLVGPHLYIKSGCGCHPPTDSAESEPFSPRPVIKEPHVNICNSNACLNGGRCIPEGSEIRCICPHHTSGNRCKILEREFQGGTYKASVEDEGGGGGWAWLPPLPSCSNVHISLDILTREEDGIILYSGELSSYQEEIIKFLQSDDVFKDESEGPEIPKAKTEFNAFEQLKFNLSSFDLGEDFFSNAPSQSVRNDKEKEKGKIKSSQIKRINKRSKRHQRTSNRVPPLLRHKLRHSKSRHSVSQTEQTRSSMSNDLIKRPQNIGSVSMSLKGALASESQRLNFFNKEINFRHISNPELSSSQLNLKQVHNTENRQGKLGNLVASFLKDPVPNSEESVHKRQDFLMLALVKGYPRLMLNLGGGNIILAIKTAYPLSDNKIHRIDIAWGKEETKMIVDLCSGRSFDELTSPTSSFTMKATTSRVNNCRMSAQIPPGGKMFNFKGPLQLGGYVSSSPLSQGDAQGDIELKTFNGCIKNLRINEDLKDLGHTVLSSKSSPGCRSVACRFSISKCGPNARCLGSPGSERCECLPGWRGDKCDQETKAVKLLKDSFITLALSFTPFSITTFLQLRFRTRLKNGQLISLSSPHGRDSLSLVMIEGILCQALRLHPDPPLYLCLTQTPLSDGIWHSVQALRVGSAMLLSVDDADGIRSNTSLSFEGRALMQLSRQDGLHIGGTPEYYSGHVINVHGDYMEGCLNDIRLQGRPLPLPPEVNGTKFGQVTTFREVVGGCESPSSCSNVTCRYPFSCIDTWGTHHCGCGEGKKPSYDGTSCADVNECLWEPCLNGGQCQNQNPGYSCSCPGEFSGRYCQIGRENREALSLSFSIGITLAASLILVFLLIGCAAFFFHKWRQRCHKSEHSSSDHEPKRNKRSSSPEEFSMQIHAKETRIGTPGANTISANMAGNYRIAGVDILRVEDPCHDEVTSCVLKKRFQALDPDLEVINTYKESKA